jgi:hypothetical protein
MGKKKKNQTPEGEVQVNQNVFSNAAAAQGAAATTVNPTNTAQAQSQIPADVQQLIRDALRVVVAQKKASGFAITLTALVRAVKKNLENYLKRTPTSAIREFIRNELVAMGYPLFVAEIENSGELYNAEIVMLYRDYNEIVEMIRAGRTKALLRTLVSNEVDPIYDKLTSKRKVHV